MPEERKKGIKTQSAKAKGRKLQQFVAKEITEKFELEEDDVVSRPMGSSGVDIIMSPEARRRFPVSVECKKTKKFPTDGDLAQSRYNAYRETIPAVVWCGHGKGPKEAKIIFSLEEFLEWAKYILL